MAYTNPAMKSGDLIFQHGSSFMSKLIEWWTGSWFSHCGVIYTTPEGLRVMEALYVGVQSTRMDTFLAFGPAEWISTNVSWTPDIEAKMLALNGQPYSHIDEFEAGLDMTPTAKGEICSLFAGQIMSFCGIKINRQGLTPAELARFFTKKGKVLRPT